MERRKLLYVLAVAVAAMLALATPALATAIFGIVSDWSLVGAKNPVRFDPGSNAGTDYISVTTGADGATANVQLTIFPVPISWYLDVLRINNTDTVKSFYIYLRIELDPSAYAGKVDNMTIYVKSEDGSTIVKQVDVIVNGAFQGVGTTLDTGWFGPLPASTEWRIDVYMSNVEGAIDSSVTLPMKVTVFWSTSNSETPP